MTYEHYNNNKYTDKLQDSLLGTEAIDKDAMYTNTIMEYNASYDNTYSYSFIYIYVYYQ